MSLLFHSADFLMIKGPRVVCSKSLNSLEKAGSRGMTMVEN